jgi:hypothetical protein
MHLPDIQIHLTDKMPQRNSNEEQKIEIQVFAFENSFYINFYVLTSIQ